MRAAPPPLPWLTNPAQSLGVWASSGHASLPSLFPRSLNARQVHSRPQASKRPDTRPRQDGARRVPSRTFTTGCRCSCLSGRLPIHARPRIGLSEFPPRPSASSTSDAGRRPAHRLLHTTRPLWFRDSSALRSQNHYETLAVSFSASAADIKKSFYKLSKKHHPDHNRSDPDAARRFMRISEAYNVLGSPDTRAAYDRDVLRHQPHVAARHPHASYHSTGPAGGRPASGLSRRRTHFRGPPPSFYRNTGSGHGAAHNPGTHGPGQQQQNRQQQHQHQQHQQHQQQQHSRPYGSGPGNVNEHDTGTRDDPHTPHFDWDRTEQMHRNMSERMAYRRATEAHGDSFDRHPSQLFGFFIIAGAIFAGVIGPALLFGGIFSPTKPTKRREPS